MYKTPFANSVTKCANLNGPLVVLITGKSIVNVAALELAAFSINSFSFDCDNAMMIGSGVFYFSILFVQQ